jgi:flagellar biosynthetic protein FlhB
VSEGGDKTEEPSQKKIDDARKEGNVWKSKDLSGLFAFVVGMSVVRASWSGFETRIKFLFGFTVDHLSHPTDLPLATTQMMGLAQSTLFAVSLPIAFGAAVAGGLLDFLQVGALFALKAVAPKLEKLNPLEGLKNMVSKKSLVEMVKSMLKLSITGYVVFGVVRDSMGMVVATIHGDVGVTMAVMSELVYRVTTKVVLLLVVFGIFDVWWQHKSYMKDQMMSKDDVKKEYKESEGDPHNKAKRKEMQMEILEGAQMEAVKSADVVVTNPEHVAVALHYDRERDSAPRVVAKGLRFKAEKIRELARASEVPLLRNVPLAHALLRVEMNEEIPEELYDAVAEVLNFVSQLEEGRAA